MSDFTFLTQEQCFGDDKLDILKIRGTKAAVTDFSILLGAYVSSNHIDNDSSLEGKTGFYWTKSDDGDNDVRTVYCDGLAGGCIVDSRIGSARIALPFSNVDSIPTNGKSGKKAKDGVLEIEYGYYPQKAASIDMQEKLEMVCADAYGYICKTGNSYTTDSIRTLDVDNYKEFLAKQHEEYEYNGKRYVRVKANTYFNNYGFVLSNGGCYKNGDNVWVEVLPVKWLVDEKAKVMITEKLIFSGVQFNNFINYHTRDFNKTEIKKFMDKYLSKELVQSRNIIEQKMTSSKTTKKNENLHNFDFTEASEEDIIKSAIKSNVAIFLHGKPGCGKSDRVKQLDPDFIELNLSHLDPELLDGLAGEKDGKAVHIKPPWLEELEEKCKDEPDKIHILRQVEITRKCKSSCSWK